MYLAQGAVIGSVTVGLREVPTNQGSRAGLIPDRAVRFQPRSEVH